MCASSAVSTSQGSVSILRRVSSQPRPAMSVVAVRESGLVQRQIARLRQRAQDRVDGRFEFTANLKNNH